MNGTVADSIIIKVGHGIMAIPRNKIKEKVYDGSSDQQEQVKGTTKYATQRVNSAHWYNLNETYGRKPSVFLKRTNTKSNS